MSVFPFLSAYDPPGTSEGTLDPLGLYQIADQLAVQLVPAVRERMQRIRFLTAMAVGALVTADLEDDPQHRDASPYLVWEWLLVEALIRERNSEPDMWGVPGTLVTRRALEQYGFLDARSYLKTPRIFGFNGVYKRLAIHLGLVDVHLGPGPNTEGLVNAWSRGLDVDAKTLMETWRVAVQRSLNEKPPRTRPNWNKETWVRLAGAFAPGGCRAREKRFLRELLVAMDDRRLGALPSLWQLQSEFADDSYREEALHNRLEKREKDYAPLLQAIRSYEAFARRLQDAFDLLKAEAAHRDTAGFSVPTIAGDTGFQQCVSNLHHSFEVAHQALAAVAPASQQLFAQRFGAFSEPMDAGSCALSLCVLHEQVQKDKSAEGKRPWFDRIAPDRIYIRHAYREPRRDLQLDRYVHDYRGFPIRRFHQDLS